MNEHNHSVLESEVEWREVVSAAEAREAEAEEKRRLREATAEAEAA